VRLLVIVKDSGFKSKSLFLSFSHSSSIILCFFFIHACICSPAGGFGCDCCDGCELLVML